MAYNTQTNFPTTIDDLIFVSDVDLSHKSVMETYQNYINQSKYTDASTYIKEQTGITPIVADLFNLLNTRTIALQTDLLEQETVQRAKYGAEPVDPDNNTIWIE